MLKSYLLLSCLCLYAFRATNGQQVDLNFCNIDTIPADPKKLPLPEIKATRYSALVEKNTGNSTEELKEFLDTIENVGVATSSVNGLSVKTYSYYKTNELFTLTGDDSCNLLKLDQFYMFSPFLLTTGPDGKETILSPLTLLMNPANNRFIYTGSTNKVRNIPVNQWQTCTYSNTTSATLRITVSFSDPDNWLSPSSIDGSKTVPIEVLIESKSSADGTLTTQTYSVTEFRPFDKKPDEEKNYLIPAGVYCPGRVNTKPLPVMPDSFTMSLQSVSALDDKDQFGVVSNTKEAYDYKSKLFQIETTAMDDTGRLFSVYEIQDFNTGLKYVFNGKIGTCFMTKITADSVAAEIENGVIRIRNSSAFFDFDGVPYQYTGQRKRNGVNTDVWIGPKVFQNKNSTWEWYIMTPEWTRQDTEDQDPTPIMLVVTFLTPRDANNTEIIDKSRNEFSFSNFRKSNMLALRHDISKCSVVSRHFSFSVTTTSPNIVKGNLPNFEAAVMETIRKTVQVTPMRISKIDISFNDAEVNVVFSLYEKSAEYGDVEIPKEDVPLAEAVQKLSEAIDSGSLVIKFAPNKQSQEIELIANKLSFNEINDREQGYTDVITLVDKKGVSGGTVAFVTILTTVVGILVSIVLLVLHKIKRVKLPFL